MDIIRKLRKKLTYFDILMAVVLLVLFLGFLLFFYRKSEYVDIRVKVTDQNVLYSRSLPQNWYANRFKVGDKERNALGKVITEITGTETFNVDSNKKAVYLDLKVKAVYDTRNGLYSARGKVLVFGTPVRFNLSEITFEGIITEFPNSQNQENYEITTKNVTALYRCSERGYVDPEVLRTVKKGDKIIDSNGNLLAEVISNTITPSLRIVHTDWGEVLLRYDPYYKDARIELALKTKMLGKELYVFDDYPLRVGDKIPLTFNEIFIKPMIIKIND